MNRILLAILILVAFTRCDRNGLEQPPCIAGAWQGVSSNDSEVNLAVEMTIQQVGNSLSGRVDSRVTLNMVVITDIGGDLASGSRYVHPATTFEVDWDHTAEALTVEGEVNASFDTITATWASYDTVVLTRQQEGECR